MRTVEKLRDDLHAAVDDGPVPPADVPGLVRGARRRRRRHLVGGAVAAAAAVAVLAAGGVLALPHLFGANGSTRLQPGGPPTAVVPPGMKPVVPGKPLPLKTVVNLRTERGDRLRLLTGSAVQPDREYAAGLRLCLVDGEKAPHGAYPAAVTGNDACHGPWSEQQMELNPEEKEFSRKGLQLVFFDGGADPSHGTRPDLIMGVTTRTVESGLMSNNTGQAAIHTVRVGDRYTVFWSYLPKPDRHASPTPGTPGTVSKTVYPSLSIQLYQGDQPVGGCGPHSDGLDYCIPSD